MIREPFDDIEKKIDETNLRLRDDFLAGNDLLTSQEVYKRAGRTATGASGMVGSWRKRRRILGIPVGNRFLYPAFQFNSHGRPLPLMHRILKSFPDDRSSWQIALWMVSSQESLDGATPVQALLAGDESVVVAAQHADELPVG